ncbi:MAG TPA: hypothetical protein VJ824_03225 [Bacillota bacterium]|nr:hypothetical protein [Bacillota bacterium]
MIIFVAVILFTLLSLRHFFPLIRRKRKREIIFYSLITTLNLTMATLMLLNINFLTPKNILCRVIVHFTGK